MSTKMYTCLEKLESMLEKGEISEGNYVSICNILKDLPPDQSQEDYWRDNYQKMERMKTQEEERVNILTDMIQTYENQNAFLLHICQNLGEQKEFLFRQLGESRQTIENLQRQLQLNSENTNKTPGNKLLDFFDQIERLHSIPRNKKTPYTKKEIETMHPRSLNVLHNKIFQN